MSIAVERRHGTTAQHATFTGINAEVTVDTTKKVVVVHDGATAGGFPMAPGTLVKAVAVENPTNAERVPLFYTDKAITITKLVAVLAGSATPSVTWLLLHNPDVSGVGLEVVTGGTTSTNVTTGHVVSSFDDATIPANSFVWLATNAKSGTVTLLSLTIFHTTD